MWRAKRLKFASSTLSRIDILGVPLDPRTARESREALAEFVDRESGCAHVVTLNPEYVMAARADRDFAAAIRRADLVLADGVGVVLAARMLGGTSGATVERLTGVDIVERLAESGTPLFFLGAGPGIAESAARRLVERFPATRVVGTWAETDATPSHDDEAIGRIAASGARAVLVAFGATNQVVWIDRNRGRLADSGARLAVGVGGAFDYLAGTAARPPRLVRSVGLEWLWRLLREPWRWRRQLVLPCFAGLVIRERARQGRRS